MSPPAAKLRDAPPVLEVGDVPGDVAVEFPAPVV